MIQICLITHGANLVASRTDIPVCHFFLHHEWELLFGVLRYYHGVEGTSTRSPAIEAPSLSSAVRCPHSANDWRIDSLGGG